MHHSLFRFHSSVNQLDTESFLKDRQSYFTRTHTHDSMSAPPQAASGEPAPAPQANEAAAADPPAAAAAPTTTAPASVLASATDAEQRAAAAAKYKRPVVGLTMQVMQLYKYVNRQYCKEKRKRAPGPKWNDGYDDKEGHYLVMYGEEIMDRYTVQEVLGKGSFGTVVKAFDEKYQENVAMKISRSGNYFYQQGKLEVDILVKLNNKPVLEDLVVKIRKVFLWQGHLCIVFELLSYNLYQLLKCTKFNGVSLDLTRKFAYQLLQVLRALEQHSPPIIHCDLKPENVLLRDQNRSGIRVIDFGSACYYSPTPRHKYIQSRFYRSPEVILELKYTSAIDRWSLGCMLVELHTGNALFPGKTELEQLVNFTNILGPLPDEMLKQSGTKRDRFYTVVDGKFVLKAPIKPPEETTKLADLLGVHSGGPRGCRKGQAGHDEATYLHFLDFVEKLLQYNPADRMSCDDAFSHPFLAPLLLLEQQHLAWRAQQEKEREAAIAAGTAPPPAPAAPPANLAGAVRPVPAPR